MKIDPLVKVALKRFTKTELADAVGVRYLTVNRWAKGAKPSRLVRPKLEKIANG